MQGEWKQYSLEDFLLWLQNESSNQSFGVYTDLSQVFYIVPPYGTLSGEFEPLADNMSAAKIKEVLEMSGYKGEVYCWEEPKPIPADDPPPPPPPAEPAQEQPETIESLKAENEFLIKEIDRIRKEYNALKAKAEAAGLKL